MAGQYFSIVTDNAHLYTVIISLKHAVDQDIVILTVASATFAGWEDGYNQFDIIGQLNLSDDRPKLNNAFNIFYWLAKR